MTGLWGPLEGGGWRTTKSLWPPARRVTVMNTNVCELANICAERHGWWIWAETGPNSQQMGLNLGFLQIIFQLIFYILDRGVRFVPQVKLIR